MTTYSDDFEGFSAGDDLTTSAKWDTYTKTNWDGSEAISDSGMRATPKGTDTETMDAFVEGDTLVRPYSIKGTWTDGETGSNRGWFGLAVRVDKGNGTCVICAGHHVQSSVDAYDEDFNSLGTFSGVQIQVGDTIKASIPVTGNDVTLENETKSQSDTLTLSHEAAQIGVGAYQYENDSGSQNHFDDIEVEDASGGTTYDETGRATGVGIGVDDTDSVTRDEDPVETGVGVGTESSDVAAWAPEGAETGVGVGSERSDTVTWAPESAETGVGVGQESSVVQTMSELRESGVGVSADEITDVQSMFETALENGVGVGVDSTDSVAGSYDETGRESGVGLGLEETDVRLLPEPVSGGVGVGTESTDEISGVYDETGRETGFGIGTDCTDIQTMIEAVISGIGLDFEVVDVLRFAPQNCEHGVGLGTVITEAVTRAENAGDGVGLGVVVVDVLTHGITAELGVGIGLTKTDAQSMIEAALTAVGIGTSVVDIPSGVQRTEHRIVLVFHKTQKAKAVFHTEQRVKLPIK